METLKEFSSYLTFKKKECLELFKASFDNNFLQAYFVYDKLFVENYVRIVKNIIDMDHINKVNNIMAESKFNLKK